MKQIPAARLNVVDYAFGDADCRRHRLAVPRHGGLERTQLVVGKHLRGLFAWEISQDDDANDLAAAMTANS